MDSPGATHDAAVGCVSQADGGIAERVCRPSCVEAGRNDLTTGKFLSDWGITTKASAWRWDKASVTVSVLGDNAPAGALPVATVGSRT